jgi:predicted homoserine dehydrogenase-like protein
MILVDKALQQREAENRPIRIGVIGAGFMGRGIVQQLRTPLTGMRLAAVVNRHIETAARAYAEAGANDTTVCNTQAEMDAAIAADRPAITNNPLLISRAAGVDAIIECTGHVESSLKTVLAAIEAHKHVVLMNAELDATLGPLLQVRAAEAGVVLSNCDGDEPGIILNLLRFVQSIGYRPVMAGNLKGFLDRYRTAETQQAFAKKTGQNAKMCAAYADGTKLCLEACLVANATGFKVGQRGMLGPKCEHVNDVIKHFTPEQLLAQPLVDYVQGAQPGAGVFVVGYNDEPAKQHYMRYLKMGDGPLYVFYNPHVLPHLEAPLTAARAVLFGDAAIAPRGAPVCDVVAIAKRDLKAGETLDGLGGNLCYGLIENIETSRAENLLPIGLANECKLMRDLPKDFPISYRDIELPVGRLSDELRREQEQYFFGSTATRNQPQASAAQQPRDGIRHYQQVVT